MAKKTRLDLFLGTDFHFKFPILNEDEDAAINITGWALSFAVKRYAVDEDADALVTKTTPEGISIAGTYNVDPDQNTQRAVVSLEDVDTDDLDPGRAEWELKRTDPGFETVLAYGEMRLFRGVHHA